MPGLGSSSARLIVIWFLSCVLRLSCAQIWPNEVLDVLYGRLESNVSLACGALPVRTPVVWHLNHSLALPWHQVTSEGSLVLLDVDLSAQGEYSCYDDQGLLLHAVRLKLGYPPGHLSISCQVPSHTLALCSWVDSVKTFLPAKYNASISKGNSQNLRPCVVDVIHKRCEIDYPNFWQLTHTVRITETNALGSFTTSDRFRLDELMKPNPPESVTATGVEGYPKRLLVSWSFPSLWPQTDGFPLLFQIRYRPHTSSYWSEVSTKYSPHEIFDALVGYPHQVQVRARDEVNSDSQWSEWSPLQYVQPWEDAASEPTDEVPADYSFPPITKPETSTEKAHSNRDPDEDANLGLVILLVLFSVMIIVTVTTFIFVMWVKQRRRSQGSKHELTSMVKMKAMPI